MVRFGVTGGIGSGKSYVLRLLAARGIPVYDSDAGAKRLMRTDTGIRKGLTDLLGEDVYTADGELNKPLVSAYLFANAQNAGRINAIVHPRVKADFNRWTSCQNAPHVALESAILFEAGFEDTVDFVVTVYAPVEMRICRVRERDGMAEAQVRKRMEAQLDDEEKCRRSDFVILNDGSKPLEVQIDGLLQILGKMEKAKD